MTAAVIGAISRLGFLQALPGLESLGAAAMRVVAEVAREQHYPPRARVAQPGDPSPVAHLVVEGELLHGAPGRSPRRVGRGEHVAWWTVLANRDIDYTLATRSGALTLALDREALLDIAEHSSHGFEVILALCRTISSRLVDRAARLGETATVLRPDRPPEQPAPWPEDMDALDAVERIVHLRSLPIFRGVNVDVVGQLARACELVRFRRGQLLAQPIHLLRGAIAWDEGGGEAVEAPALLGLPHALCGRPASGSPRAIASGTALRGDIDLLVDLAEDNPDLALALVTGLAVRLRGDSG